MLDKKGGTKATKAATVDGELGEPLLMSGGDSGGVSGRGGSSVEAAGELTSVEVLHSDRVGGVDDEVKDETAEYNNNGAVGAELPWSWYCSNQEQQRRQFDRSSI